MPVRQFGHELQIGDVIDVWWDPGRSTIIALHSYVGPLAYLWRDCGGARIATFAERSKLKMTVGPDDLFTVFNRDA
jgi:hypothetical protein